MDRFFLEIKYDGTAYHGWQIQKNSNTIQQQVNLALSTLLQSEIMVTGVGRTDTGVHAKQFFVHFDTAEVFDKDKLLYKLNNFLPPDISCSSIRKVKNDAHARFSAKKRTYEYWLTTKKDPFLVNRAFLFPFELDLNLMNVGANELLSHQDFSSFAKSHSDTKTTLCSISYANWERNMESIIFTITANRFLRNMVRAIVGTLIDVGQKRTTIDDLKRIIDSGNRSEAGVSVPAHGLYLTKIEYPQEIYG